MNRGSIDLGLGRSTFMRTYNAERRRFPGGQVEEIEKPGTSLQEVKGLKPDESYVHLEGDGLPLPEKYLEGGDVLVGKTSPPRFLEESSGGAFLMAQEKKRVINACQARRERLGRQCVCYGISRLRPYG